MASLQEAFMSVELRIVYQALKYSPGGTCLGPRKGLVRISQQTVKGLWIGHACF